MAGPDVVDRKKDEFANYLTEAERRDRDLLQDTLRSKFKLKNQSMIDLFMDRLYIRPDASFEKRIVVKGKAVFREIGRTVHNKPILRKEYPDSKIVEFDKQVSTKARQVQVSYLRRGKTVSYMLNVKPRLMFFSKGRIVTWRKLAK